MRQSAPLLSAKLLPPTPGPFYLPRPRLFERLASGLDGRSTVVLAGPGYGKTALVSRFLQERGEETVWYSLDPTDGDPGVFFRYLVHGIREHAAEFGERSEGAWSTRGSTAADVERLADIFVNEAEENLSGRLVLVLDGVHHLESSAACLKALRRVLTWAPGTLHTVLIGRSLPDLGIRALEAEGAVNIVRDDELRFTLDETRALLSQSFGLDVTEETAKSLHERTRGWVTALQLLRQTARLGSGARSIPAHLFEKTESEVFDYFSEEVLASEPQAVREFLLTSSLSDFIDPEICSEVAPGVDVHEILGRLVKKHLFLSPLESRTEYYAYDPLFRDFLRRRLLADKGLGFKRQLDARYARSFARRGAFPEAIAHGISAEDVGAVVDLLRHHGHALLRAGTMIAVIDAARFASARGAGGAVTDDLLGEAARLSGDYSGAVAHFERALGAQTDGGPELVGTARATTLQGLAYSLMKRSENGRAAQFAEQALSEAGESDHGLIARIHNTVAILRYRENRLPEALSGWQTALDHARKSGDHHLVLMVAHNLGLPHAVMGDFQRAAECFQILTGPENLHVGPQEGAAYLNLARIATIRGEFGRAGSFLGDAAEIARKLRLQSLAADALEAEGNLLRELGDHEAASERYTRARRIFTELGQMDVVRNLDEEVAILAAHRGSFEEAERLGSSVVAEGRAAGEPESVASSLLALGEVRVRSSRAEAAVEVLKESTDLYQTIGRAYQEFLSRMWLALARFLSADAVGAREDASAAFVLASRFDYRAPLMRIAVLDGAFLKMLGEMPNAPVHLIQAEPRAAATGAGFPIPGAGPTADLTVRLFGPIEIFRDEERKVPAAAWKIRRALELFCYLASSRNRRASKDRLVDALWGNARPATVDKNFHPTISFLRRALNHAHPVLKNFLLYERGVYLLNPSYTYDIDTETFESRIRRARGMVTRADTDLACVEYGLALTMYHGPFMEEEYAEWTEPLRSHFSELRTRALAELADLRFRSGDTEAAVELFGEVVAIDPVDERASAGFMRTLAARGDRAGIEKEWLRIGEQLRRDIGAAPSGETRRAYESALETVRSRPTS